MRDLSDKSCCKTLISVLIQKCEIQKGEFKTILSGSWLGTLPSPGHYSVGKGQQHLVILATDEQNIFVSPFSLCLHCLI